MLQAQLSHNRLILPSNQEHLDWCQHTPCPEPPCRKHSLVCKAGTVAEHAPRGKRRQWPQSGHGHGCCSRHARGPGSTGRGTVLLELSSAFTCSTEQEGSRRLLLQAGTQSLVLPNSSFPQSGEAEESHSPRESRGYKHESTGGTSPWSKHLLHSARPDILRRSGKQQ